MQWMRIRAGGICLALFFAHFEVSAESTEQPASDELAVQLSTYLASPLAGAVVARGWHRNVLWGATIGIGSAGWNVFAQMDFGFYGNPSLGLDSYNEILNVGLGASLLSLNRRIRTTVSLGPSFLLTDSFANSAGAVGLYVDLRPAGILFSLGKTVLELVPLSLSVTAPVLHGVPLILIQYRTAVALWISF
jgi:hypothetical protein